MGEVIKLTIQEMVADYESLIRCHERIDALLDFEKAEEEEMIVFYGRMMELSEKYMQNYLKHVSGEYANSDAFGRALELYGMLHDNSGRCSATLSRYIKTIREEKTMTINMYFTKPMKLAVELSRWRHLQ